MTASTLRALALASTLALASATVSAASFTIDLGGGDGTVLDISKPSGKFDLTFVMIGSDSNSNLPVITRYTTTASESLLVTGEYSYLSNDCCGPVFDPFGFVVNDVLTQLTDDDGNSGQAGTFSFNVAAGDTYGWFIRSSDDILGAASVSVGADLAAVPVPASLPLLGTAVAGIVALRRRRA